MIAMQLTRPSVVLPCGTACTSLLYCSGLCVMCAVVPAVRSVWSRQLQLAAYGWLAHCQDVAVSLVSGVTAAFLVCAAVCAAPLLCSIASAGHRLAARALVQDLTAVVPRQSVRVA